MWEIPRVIVNKILGHAQRAAPEECVGLLSSKSGTINGWHPLTNTLHETERFLADPTEQIGLFKSLREQGREVAAIYHSHPNGPAELSPRDLAEDHYPEALKLVVSLSIEGTLELNAFLVKEGKAVVQELTIIEQS